MIHDNSVNYILVLGSRCHTVMKIKTNIGISSCILQHKSNSSILTGDSDQHWQWQFQQRDQGIFVLHNQTTTAYVLDAATMASCNMFAVKEKYFVHESSAYVHMNRTEQNKKVSIHLYFLKFQTSGAVVDHIDYPAVYSSCSQNKFWHTEGSTNLWNSAFETRLHLSLP